MLTALLIAWVAFTAVLVVLLIYRGTLTMREDDQLFLDAAEEHMQKEQEELINKVNRLTPWLRICGASSGVLLVTLAGYALIHNMSW